MRLLPGSRRTVPLVAVAACLAGLAGLLAGCGQDDPGRDKVTEESTAWPDLDICSLLTDDQVSDALATAEPVTATADTSDADRPACTWAVDASSTELEVSLWAPPLPAALTDGNETVPVGSRTGYVQGSNDSQCFLQVEGEDFWVGLDLDAETAAADPDFCSTEAAPLADLVFSAATG